MRTNISKIMGVPDEYLDDGDLRGIPIDTLEARVFDSLKLDPVSLSPTFRDLIKYWDEKKLPRAYVIYAVQILDEMDKKGVLRRTTKDWYEVGRFLADATAATYQNGSYQFLTDAVPAVISSRNVKTQEQFMAAVRILVNEANSRGHGEHLYSDIANRIVAGTYQFA